ncbi:alpha/beta hydrolase [Clostridium tarantellae]|uniref:Prolyl oligopeptidase family serine peptidase n=1 Tax=Clostridium tarantellae TaxID=39493 RepID=A0A6I1MUQ6_9CLOT|nr:prolyl oligopeptidase family serine peptidase [Clostridium tarantellae]
MKKFLKGVLAILLVFCLIIGIILFTFKTEINIVTNIAKNYMGFLENMPEVVDVEKLDMMDTMDYKDVTYKVRDGKNLTLDIYGPKKKLKNGSPVILYVHGGSWVYGNKGIPKFLAPLLDAFRDEGFTVISTSYELMKDELSFDKQISDIKDTIRWIHKNESEYGLNGNVGIIGVSSGAHLSLMAAYTPKPMYSGALELSAYPTDVDYIIDFFGPTDLSTLDMGKAGWDLNQIIKKAEKVKNKQKVIEEYSVINYIDGEEVDTLIIHSKMDNIVPYENSIKLYEKLKKYNNNVELLTLDTSGHDLSNISKEDVVPVAWGMLKFILNHSKI